MAISYLGERMIANIALATCSHQFFNKELEGYDSPRGELWAHSLMTAIASRIASKNSKKPVNSNLVYTAGLLHDIGKSVISSMLSGTSEEILKGINENKYPDYLQAEREILGIDHCEAGAALANEWKLPAHYKNAISFHHSPRESDAEFAQLCFAVHIGDIIAMMSGSGTGADSLQHSLCPEYKEYFDFSENDLQEIILLTGNEFKAVSESLNINGG
jgi:putative nucleotidyltransferase with HDIG domain